MMWKCRVCNEPAVQVMNVATSGSAKSGSYRLLQIAHCAKHLPQITKLREKKDALPQPSL